MNSFFENIPDLPHLPLELRTTLVYYDGPKLGVCSTSDSAVFYLFSAVEAEADEDFAYLFLKTDEDSLQDVLEGQISLYDAYISAQDEEVYRVSASHHAGSEKISVTALNPATIPDKDLAEPNVFLNG